MLDELKKDDLKNKVKDWLDCNSIKCDQWERGDICKELCYKHKGNLSDTLIEDGWILSKD